MSLNKKKERIWRNYLKRQYKYAYEDEPIKWTPARIARANYNRSHMPSIQRYIAEAYANTFGANLRLCNVIAENRDSSGAISWQRWEKYYRENMTPLGEDKTLKE